MIVKTSVVIRISLYSNLPIIFLWSHFQKPFDWLDENLTRLINFFSTRTRNFYSVWVMVDDSSE